ncbi:MAG: hypothetical protein V5A39_13365 [Haloarculaceae archaeon]
MGLRESVGITRHRQKQATYVMELLLGGIVFIGIERGSTTVIVNGLVGLGVTQIPPILERDYDVPMDPALTLWITTAVFLHALGVLGLPGSEQNFYGTIWWWDHVTHALSSSVVAAVGYATARALDVHSDDIHLPPRFMFVYILIFVIAFGVLWEVIEFGLGEGARMMGNQALLTQHGLRDSMLDLVFDTVGAVVVAVWGTAHLTGVSGYLAAALGARNTE